MPAPRRSAPRAAVPAAARGEVSAMKTKTMAALVSVGVSALILSMAGPASAEQPTSGGYEYKFTDDPLKAEGMGGTTPQILVLKGKHREKLHRPRLHFITEMLKSVENM
jgi:hypothetical protein